MLEREIVIEVSNWLFEYNKSKVELLGNSFFFNLMGIF